MKQSTEQSQNTREHWISLYAAKITSMYKAIAHNSTWVREKVIFYFNCLVTECFNAGIDDESLSLLKKDLEAALKSTPLPLNKEERKEVWQIIKRLNRDDLHCRLTNEDKKELFIALCGYYPYGVICHDTDPNAPTYSKDGKLRAIRPEPGDCNGLPYLFELEGISFLSDICEIKPYLRPMDSMTDKEIMDYKAIQLSQAVDRECEAWDEVNWLNARFLDYRGLIPRGLALETKEGMYNLK